MSKQLTKAQILANYEAALVRCQELEAQLASLRASQQPQRPAVQPQRVVREPHSLPAHFAAARELAMRTGRAVKVGA